jgi:hypothetical protein
VIGPASKGRGPGGGDRFPTLDPDRLYSFEALYRAYRECRRNKRNTFNALAFEIDAEAKLLELRRELRDHIYRPGRSICFITGGPKPREVFAADFRDRVVHHLLVRRQEEAFEPAFIHDSYACRRDRGALAASDRLMQFLRRITANGRRPAWGLKLDVADFFPSVHKQTLFDVIGRRVEDPELLWLTRAVLFHDPTTNYVFRTLDRRTSGPEAAGYPVPFRKSLFGKRNERGLPIGNLTSQFWGNVYLNELDQFVKRVLGCRHYIRYVDDLVLLSRDREELVHRRQAISDFLHARLRLRLRPGGLEPFPVGRGVEFVGWKTWRNRRLPRRRTLGNLRGRLQSFEQRAVRRVGRAAGRIDWQKVAARATGPRTELDVGKLHAALASYSGHLRHGAAWSAWAAAWEDHPWLTWLFVRDAWRARRLWIARERRAGRGFGLAYRRMLRGFPSDCLVFLRVGRFVEFYGPQRIMAERVLGLRAAWLPRAGYALTAGFPVGSLRRFAGRALSRGHAVAFVPRREESGELTDCFHPSSILFPPARVRPPRPADSP